MNKISILAAASALFASQAAAGTFLTVVAPEGSVSAGVIGINDQGQVAGSFVTASDEEKAFVGSVDGTYETFDYEGLPTQARAINNQGAAVGLFAPAGSLNQFVRSADGTISVVTKDDIPLIGIAQGINPKGEFVGDYVQPPSSVPSRGGYLGEDGVFKSDVTLPFPTIRVAPRAINAKGDIAGWFVAAPGEAAQGFVNSKGVTTVLAYPEANQATFVQGMNNKGELSGSWVDADGISHGFILASDHQSWTSFDAPAGDQTQAWQINAQGQIAVTSFTDTESFLYVFCPKPGGICSGRNEVSATAKAVKGKAPKATPGAVGRGVDPDAATPRGRGRQP